MEWKTSNPKTRLYLIAAAILMAGLGSAVFIYLSAEHSPGDVVGYEGAGGYIYPMSPEDSKMYRHDLELFGGKVNVLAEGISRWFIGLWHGKSLAVIVAFMSILLSSGCFIAARHRRSGPKDDIVGEDT